MSGETVGNWSVRWKISSLIVVSIALAVCLGCTAWISISNLAQKSDEQDVYRQASLYLARLDTKASLIDSMINANLAFPSQTSTFAESVATYTTEGDDLVTSLKKLDLSSSDSSAVSELATSWSTFTASATETQSSLTTKTTSTQLYKAGETLFNTYSTFATSLGTVVTSIDKKATSAATAQNQLVSKVRWIVGSALVLGVLLLAVFGWFIARSILAPLQRAVDALRRVAQRDYTGDVPVKSRDEIGQMSEALNAAIGDIRTAIGDIAHGARSLTDASERLSAISVSVDASSEEASAQVGTVSDSSVLVSERVREAAQGAEQMTAAIREISGNTTTVAQIAQGAVSTAEETTSAMSKLSASTDEIGNVIKLITSIAEQTNLLALNATIEAARAGESGKGFAVVASEVKDLAQSTARATEDIGQRIEAIQGDTGNAIAAIGRIAEVISDINQYQTSIAGAVEEQTATTNELSRLFDDAARGADAINQSIGQVAATAAQTAEGATSTREAASDLSALAASLNDVVSRFRIHA
ncbi:methyl-accepting chemotaxis protein [Actinoplanes sp. NPDC051851]|uniref:methyl-accepting chemotaxis protein n=1 Tax=Actinoplanes sp. NPDC051851 TaxID=3154753 RepID=UPI003433AC1D